jgi:hypothetical protein
MLIASNKWLCVMIMIVMSDINVISNEVMCVCNVCNISMKM